MLMTITIAGWIGLITLSFLLGLISPVPAARRRIWKALGLWGLGLAAGGAGVALSFRILELRGQERGALIAAGRKVPVNDMPGYGQVLLAAYGLIYFALLLAIILVVFAIAVMRHRARAAPG